MLCAHDRFMCRDWFASLVARLDPSKINVAAGLCASEFHLQYHKPRAHAHSLRTINFPKVVIHLYCICSSFPGSAINMCNDAI